MERTHPLVVHPTTISVSIPHAVRAAANGVPTLALFGPTTRELGFFPYGEGHRVLEVDLTCRPCGLHGRRACPEGHFLCMRLISVEQVYRQAMEMIRSPSTAGKKP